MSKLSQAEVMTYLQEHPFVTLSTVTPGNEPDASAMYCYADETLTLYMVTSEKTQKVANIQHQPSVVVTASSERKQSVMEIAGHATIHVKDAPEVLKQLIEVVSKRVKTGGSLPLLKHTHQGKVVIAIKSNKILLREYAGDELLERQLNP